MLKLPIGRTLIFSNELGLSVNGDIVLPQDTVSDAWIYVCSNDVFFANNLTLMAK